MLRGQMSLTTAGRLLCQVGGLEAGRSVSETMKSNRGIIG